MKRALFVSASLIFTLLTGAAAHAQDKTPAPPDTLAATVNGQPIMDSDVMALHQSLPPQYRQIPFEQLRGQLLERLIEQKLVSEAARKEGLLKRSDIQKRIEMVTESMLHEIYIEEKIGGAVTEAKVRDAYQKSIPLESKREEVRARHILVKTREAAVAIIVEVNGGADFADVARKKSTGPSGRNGGDLGFFTSEQMVPAFSKAAFALKPGEVTSEPVQTQFGWHVIKVEEKRMAGASSFEESADKIRADLRTKAYEKAISDLRAKATIDITGGGASKIQPLR
jgi:peptidyl-prolyl cis-trans isomerase C